MKKYVSNLKSAWLGIWYGYPDARVRVCNSDVPFIAQESHHEQSPGDSIVVETKLEKGVNLMLNKNSLAVKKVRGQSEATMAISDQNL